MAIAARRTCLDEQIQGESCEVDQVDDFIATWHQRSRDLVTRQCGSFEAAQLNYGSATEMGNDILNVCIDLEDSVISASYLPFLTDAAAAVPGPTAVDCMRAASRAAGRLVRFADRNWRSAFGRMAAHNVPFPAKLGLVERAQERIDRAADKLRAQIEEACPTSEFAELYGRNTGEFLSGIAQRTRCFAGEAFVQAAVICPASVCGNGMRERQEQCDDGNSTSGDGCSSACRVEAGFGGSGVLGFEDQSGRSHPLNPRTLGPSTPGSS
jgi:cysteine-rich repeat protein